MTNNIAVSITADVSDLVVKRAVLSAELKAATSDLNSFAKTANASGMTKELQAGMLAAADKAQKARASIALLNKEIKELSATGGGVSPFAGLNKGLESVKGAAESVSGLRESIMGVGSAFAAAFAVNELVEWARKMGEAGEQTEHTAQILGTGVGVVQQLNSAFALMGVDSDKGVVGIERLDKAFAMAREGSKQQATAFKELGVSTGQNYTQMQLLGAVMDGFAKQADGPAKAAEAMMLFGRAGAAMIPFLDLGSKGLAQINDITAKYGAVSGDAVEKSAQLGEAFNENKVAMSGVSNVMASAFAPALTLLVRGTNDLIASWTASYKAGGAVKVVMDILVVAFKAVIDTVALLGTAVDLVFKTIDGGVWMLQGVLTAGFDAIVGSIDVTRDSFVTFGRVAVDALTLNWGAIEGDIKNGLRQVSADVAATTRKMGQDAAAGFAQGAKEWQSSDQDVGGYEAWSKKFWAGKPSASPVKPTGEGAEGDTSGDQAKGGKHKNDEVQIWEQQLQQKLEAEKNYFGDSKSEELAFWTAKLALTTAGSAQQRQVQTKVYGLTRDLARQGYTQHLATLNDQLEADKNSWAKTQSDWAEKLAYIKAHYGAESDEYKNAEREEEASERTHEQTLREIQRANGAEALAELKSNLDVAKSVREANARTQESQANAKGSYSPIGEVQAAVQIAAIHRQMLAQQAADDAAYEAKKDALLQDEINWMVQHNQTETVAYQQAVNAKKLADLDWANQKKALEAQATQQSIQDAQTIQQKWQSITQPIGSSFAQMFQGMYMRQETFSQAALKMGDQLLFKFVDVAMQDLAKWTATQLAKTGIIKAQTTMQGLAQAVASGNAAIAQKTADEAAVTGYAGEAAAATFAAWSPMSMVDPGLPAEMAAAAAAQTMSFGSFATGVDVVPRDMINLTHAGERIMPAADNRAIMAAVSRGTSGGNGGGDRGGAPTFHQAFEQHFHEASPDPKALVGVMMPEIMTQFQKMHRRGMFK